MALLDIDNLKSMISKGMSAEEERAAFRKLLITVLARASRVDLNTDAAEVDKIQAIVAEYTGADIDAAAVRTEAIMQARETNMKSVSKLASKMSESYRVLVIKALKQVILADDQVSHTEIDYFNAVAAALRLSFADVAELVEG